MIFQRAAPLFFQLRLIDYDSISKEKYQSLLFLCIQPHKEAFLLRDKLEQYGCTSNSPQLHRILSPFRSQPMKK